VTAVTYFCFDHQVEIPVPTKGNAEHAICTLFRVWAEFVAWSWPNHQVSPRADFLIKGHTPRRGKIVDANTLLRWNIKIPALPPCPWPEAA
jgi:hypothetical protein